MDIIRSLIDLFLHLDTHLGTIIADYGVWTYIILFLIIFCETGLVIMPFLPGDSLIFAAGAFSATGALNPWLVFILLTAAAIIGDTVNYWLGVHAGPRVFQKESSIFFHKDHLIRAEKFYEAHGGKTIILARFMPIIRTFAPFVAGIGRMPYGRFLTFNIVGGIIWVGLFTWAGYAIGNVPFIKDNFHYVILIIISASFIPPIYNFIKGKITKKPDLPAA